MSDKIPAGTRVRHISTDHKGMLVGYTMNETSAVVEWDDSKQVGTINPGFIEAAQGDDNNMTDLLFKQHPNDKLYQVVLSVPYFVYADSAKGALAYAQDAIYASDGFFTDSQVTHIRDMRDAKYLNKFTDDDTIFNCEDYYATLGEAKARLKRTGAKSGAKVKAAAKVTAKKNAAPVKKTVASSKKTSKKK